MEWRMRWKALAARIQGLIETGRFLIDSADAVGSDFVGVINQEVIPNAKATFGEIERLTAAGNSLPPAALSALERFVATHRKRIQNEGLIGWPGLQAHLAPLASFKAEFEHLLADTEAVGSSLALRSFMHLQRSIVVVKDVAAQWRTAFAEGEVACERLGAIQLLSHGIFAFKVNATGERTDLVFGEPIQSFEAVQDTAEALVLTEWKVVRRPSDHAVQAEQALKQAKRYAAGVLAGLELTRTRFLVLVSSDHLTLPADVREGGVTYRYLNVAVEPTPPSAAGRQI